MYFESALVEELQSVFGFEEDSAKSIVQLAKETGEYQDLCACIQFRKDAQEVMQDVQPLHAVQPIHANPAERIPLSAAATIPSTGWTDESAYATIRS